MLHYLIAWMSMIVAFLLIDAIWLGLLARDFYQRHIGYLMREEIWFGVAGMFYLLYTVALLILVVGPAHRSGTISQAFMLGALLGLCAYGTYDVTNLATLRGWPVIVAVVDIAWGAVLTATVAAIGYQVLAWSSPA